VPFPKTLGQATYTAKNGKQYKGAAYPVYEFVSTASSTYGARWIDSAQPTCSRTFT
jgi:hypothetical protein